MKKYTKHFLPFALTVCAFVFSARAHAQFQDELEDITGHWEVGITGGANNFLGDLGGNKGVGTHFIKDFNGPATRGFGGISVNYFKYSWLSIKGSINYTTVTGADSLIVSNKQPKDAERWRLYRNLSFRSRILEANVSAEIYPVMLFDKQNEIHTFSPYIGIGIGVFHFNPQTNYKGEWVDLRPLRLEGEGFSGTGINIDPDTHVESQVPYPKEYHRLQVYIPLTIGLKVYLNNTFAISGGFITRKTFTDYIDDIHTKYIDRDLFDKYLNTRGTVGNTGLSQAALAKELYSRSLTPFKVRPGVYKANPNDNDSYITMFLTLSMRLGSGPKFFYGG